MDADRYHFRLFDLFPDLSAVHLEHNLIGGKMNMKAKALTAILGSVLC